MAITTQQSCIPYETLFADSLEQVNMALKQYLNGEEGERFRQARIPGPEKLWEAMRYSTLDGGKRIRPVLAIESCLGSGGRLENILPTACAIELVHAQSLIHDDLPCMDNDDLRRGKPTLHKAFNESTAVLAGDALLAMAFGLITRETPRSAQVSAETLLAVITDFSNVASVQGLVNGQFVDIYYEGQPYTPEVLEYIHTYKTGALFTFSARAGARLAGADADTVEAFTAFGQKLGLAFQIVDDLLDIHSTSESLGKTPGKDRAQEKATFPALYGETESRKKAERLIQEAVSLIEGLSERQVLQNAGGLKALASYIGVRIH